MARGKTPKKTSFFCASWIKSKEAKRWSVTGSIQVHAVVHTPMLRVPSRFTQWFTHQCYGFHPGSRSGSHTNVTGSIQVHAVFHTPVLRVPSRFMQWFTHQCYGFHPGSRSGSHTNVTGSIQVHAVVHTPMLRVPSRFTQLFTHQCYGFHPGSHRGSHTNVTGFIQGRGGGGIQYNAIRCMGYSTIQCIQYETMQYDTMQREAKYELINMIYTGLRIFETNHQNGCHNGGHKSEECKYHHISRPKGSEQRPQEATPFQWMTCSPEWPRQNCCEPWMPKLDGESSRRTTFNTPFGKHRFLRLPFGINNSSQRCISKPCNIFSKANRVL